MLKFLRIFCIRVGLVGRWVMLTYLVGARLLKVVISQPATQPACENHTHTHTHHDAFADRISRLPPSTSGSQLAPADVVVYVVYTALATQSFPAPTYEIGSHNV
jgi:hypothetical protein